MPSWPSSPIPSRTMALCPSASSCTGVNAHFPVLNISTAFYVGCHSFSLGGFGATCHPGFHRQFHQGPWRCAPVHRAVQVKDAGALYIHIPLDLYLGFLLSLCQRVRSAMPSWPSLPTPSRTMALCQRALRCTGANTPLPAFCGPLETSHINTEVSLSDFPLCHRVHTCSNSYLIINCR
jgi:hypothetical protein